MEIPVHTVVEAKKVASLLCSAFDPACNAVGYWCEVVKYEQPQVMQWQDSPEQVYPYMDYPLNTGGAVIVKDLEDNDRHYKLGLPQIIEGIRSMSQKDPQHFADVMTDDADNTTADVFIQHCLFGEVRYS